MSISEFFLSASDPDKDEFFHTHSAPSTNTSDRYLFS